MNMVRKGKLNYDLIVKQINLFMPDGIKEVYLSGVEQCKNSGEINILNYRTSRVIILNRLQRTASQMNASIPFKWCNVSIKPIRFRYFPESIYIGEIIQICLQSKL